MNSTQFMRGTARVAIGQNTVVKYPRKATPCKLFLTVLGSTNENKSMSLRLLFKLSTDIHFVLLGMYIALSIIIFVADTLLH